VVPLHQAGKRSLVSAPQAPHQRQVGFTPQARPPGTCAGLRCLARLFGGQNPASTSHQHESRQPEDRYTALRRAYLPFDADFSSGRQSDVARTSCTSSDTMAVPSASPPKFSPKSFRLIVAVAS
jgi:hypothetical protein